MADLSTVDPAFGIDDFNKSKVYPSDETIVRNLLLLLFGKPGFYPSMPKLGMNIREYLYTLEDDMDTSAIKAKLAYQCSEFLPLLEDGKMDIYATHMNGNPVLLFALPVIRQTRYSDLVIGITTLANGEMQFNFAFSDESNNKI